MSLFDKPAAGTPVNTSHPLAPRSAQGFLFGLLDSTVSALVDDAYGKTMTTVGPAPVFNASPSFPGATTGPALVLSSVPGNISQFTSSGNPSTSAGGWITLMGIAKIAAYAAGGPRLIGAGENGDITLVPNGLSTDKFYILNNGLAFVDSGLTSTLGDWVFFGASVKNNDHADVVIYDYNAASGANATIAFGPISTGDGIVAIGNIDQTHDTWGTNGSLYWGMVDYAQWSIADMQAVAASPFAMYSTALTAGTLSHGTVAANSVPLSVTTATSGTSPYTYKLQQAPDVSGSPGTWADVGTYQSGLTWTATGLTPYTTYWWRVIAKDSAGTPATANSNQISVLTAPATLVAGVVGVGGITTTSVIVSTSLDSGGLTPYAYKLQQAPDVSGSPGTWADVGTYQAGTNWTVTGLTTGTPYWWRVVSIESSSFSMTATSNAVTATPAVPPARVADRWFPGLGKPRPRPRMGRGR